MVGPFPLAKLGFLVVKQISKPIATGFARRAKTSPFFRDYICIPTAQFFHWYDVQVRMRVLNLGKATTVPKLNEAKAIETGAQLLSELILFSIGVGILVFEYVRQSEKDEAKKEQVEREKAYLLDKVQNLEFMLERQNVDIKQLSRLTYKLQDDIYQSGSRKDKSKGSSKSSESSASSSNALQETSFDIDSSSHVKGTDEAVSRGNGIVTSALNDLLGPASQEFEEVISGELSYDSRGSVIVVPGLVTEAVDHFLNSCQDADHEMRRRD